MIFCTPIEGAKLNLVNWVANKTKREARFSTAKYTILTKANQSARTEVLTPYYELKTFNTNDSSQYRVNEIQNVSNKSE